MNPSGLDPSYPINPATIGAHVWTQTRTEPGTGLWILNPTTANFTIEGFYGVGTGAAPNAIPILPNTYAVIPGPFQQWRIPTTPATAGTGAHNISIAFISGIVPQPVYQAIPTSSGMQVTGNLTVDSITGAVTITLPAGASLPVSFGSAQEVIIASGNSNTNITNALLSMNPVPIGTNQASGSVVGTDIVDLLPGDVIQINVELPTGLYDGVILAAKSHESLMGSYSFILNAALWNEIGLDVANTENLDFTSAISNSSILFTNTLDIVPAGILNQLIIRVTNTGTTAITDTLDLYVFGRFASQHITNPISSPVNTKSVSSGINLINAGYGAAGGSASGVLLSAGGTIKKCFLTIANQDDAASYYVYLMWGNSTTAPEFISVTLAANQTVVLPMDFDTGTANAGIYAIANGGSSGGNVQFSGFAMIE